MTPTITINSKDYAVAELSEAAKAQIANIQVADAELAPGGAGQHQGPPIRRTIRRRGG